MSPHRKNQSLNTHVCVAALRGVALRLPALCVAALCVTPALGATNPRPTTAPGVTAPVPAAAAAVGYNTRTFGPNVTLNGNWFSWNFYGVGAQPAGAASQNADGSVFLSGMQNNSYGATIASARQTNSGKNWAGKAFGGGAYFEAALSFTGQGNGPYKNGGPAFWGLDVEHTSQGPYIVGWPGAANPWSATTSYAVNAMASFNNQVWISNIENNRGNSPPTGTSHGNPAWRLYNNFFEVDFMEYDSTEYTYQNGIGNWWGNSGGSLNGPSGSTHNTVIHGVAGQVAVPAGTDFSQFHKYGCLWVPATPGTQGYLKFYFDGVQTGQTFTWDYHDIANPAAYPAPPPVNGSTAMSGMDWRHLMVILGTGTTQPMTVQSVSVWQASSANDLIE